MLSLAVGTVWVTFPVTGTVTVLEPRSLAATTAPDCVTVNDTANGDAGAGEAVTVKVAGVPSVTAGPAVTITTGFEAVPSSLAIFTEAPPVATTPPPPRPTEEARRRPMEGVIDTVRSVLSVFATAVNTNLATRADGCR